MRSTARPPLQDTLVFGDADQPANARGCTGTHSSALRSFVFQYLPGHARSLGATRNFLFDRNARRIGPHVSRENAPVEGPLARLPRSEAHPPSTMRSRRSP